MAIDIREQGQEMEAKHSDQPENDHGLEKLRKIALYSVNLRSQESARRAYKLFTGNDPVETND